jgi:hypothetical protein
MTMRSINPRAVSRSRRGARLACGPRRSDGHLLAEVAHEQDGAHEEPRGAEQVLSGKREAGDRQMGLALGRARHERGKPLPRSLGRRGDTRRERARTMVLSRFGGANSLSMISFTPMIAETRAVVVRPACLDGPKHATAKERACFVFGAAFSSRADVQVRENLKTSLLMTDERSAESPIARVSVVFSASATDARRAQTTRLHRRRASHAPHPRPQVPPSIGESDLKTRSSARETNPKPVR